MEVKSVTESIVQYLREHIISGDLAPGQKLTETELSTQMGVSRPPLREALRIMENDNLVVRIPRKGSYVTELSVDRLHQLYAAREMIECHVLDILKEENRCELPGVRKSLDDGAVLSPPAKEDTAEMMRYLNALTDFHVKLVQAAGNQWVLRFYDSITFSLARYQYLCLHVPGLTSRSYEMHGEILALIEQGLFDRARERLIAHIHLTTGFIEERLERGMKNHPSRGKSSPVKAGVQ